MLVSVVIPTFNRAHMLENSCAALMNQKVDDDVQYEVIFVSNGSVDDTPEVLEHLAERYGKERLRHFHIDPTGGPSAPRNRGIREARGDVIVILDDDVVADSDLIQAYADYHREHPAQQDAAVGVAYVPEFMLDKPVSLFHAFDYAAMTPEEEVSYTFFWTCNVSVKKKFMLDYGMFDERFLYNEDLVCGYALNNAGMKLRYWPKARGQHLHQLRLEDVERKGTMVGRWIWAISHELHNAEILDRYGVLSPKLGPRRFFRRLLNRTLFRLIDNPLTHLSLRMLGARNGNRSRWSDLHYYLIYRRAIVAGYSEARKKYRNQVAEFNIDPPAFVRQMMP